MVSKWRARGVSIAAKATEACANLIANVLNIVDTILIKQMLGRELGGKASTAEVLAA